MKKVCIVILLVGLGATRLMADEVADEVDKMDDK